MLLQQYEYEEEEEEEGTDESTYKVKNVQPASQNFDESILSYHPTKKKKKKTRDWMNALTRFMCNQPIKTLMNQ